MLLFKNLFILPKIHIFLLHNVFSVHISTMSRFDLQHKYWLWFCFLFTTDLHSFTSDHQTLEFIRVFLTYLTVCISSNHQTFVKSIQGQTSYGCINHDIGVGLRSELLRLIFVQHRVNHLTPYLLFVCLFVLHQTLHTLFKVRHAIECIDYAIKE